MTVQGCLGPVVRTCSGLGRSQPQVTTRYQHAPALQHVSAGTEPLVGMGFWCREIKGRFKLGLVAVTETTPTFAPGLRRWLWQWTHYCKFDTSLRPNIGRLTVVQISKSCSGVDSETGRGGRILQRRCNRATGGQITLHRPWSTAEWPWISKLYIVLSWNPQPPNLPRSNEVDRSDLQVWSLYLK